MGLLVLGTWTEGWGRREGDFRQGQGVRASPLSPTIQNGGQRVIAVSRCHSYDWTNKAQDESCIIYLLSSLRSNIFTNVTATAILWQKMGNCIRKQNEY